MIADRRYSIKDILTLVALIFLFLLFLSFSIRNSFDKEYYIDANLKKYECRKKKNASIIYHEITLLTGEQFSMTSKSVMCAYGLRVGDKIRVLVKGKNLLGGWVNTLVVLDPAELKKDAESNEAIFFIVTCTILGAVFWQGFRMRHGKLTP